MGIIADVNNGELIGNSTAPATSNIGKAEKAASKEAGGTMDKDAFLQLLVAQMKYQDPLEPTDNTEYVSQLATFSELEEMQNMVKSSDMQRASGLVGKYVSIAEKDNTGNVKNIEGYVDGVVYQGSKTYLKINEVLYNLDDLDKVYDDAYVYAMKAAEAAAKAAEEAAKNKAEEKVAETGGAADSKTATDQNDEGTAADDGENTEGPQNV